MFESKNTKIVFALIIIIIIILGIIGVTYYIINMGEVKVHLYVSNQSFEDASTNITITIDKEEQFKDQCWVNSQHNWTLTELTLSKGDHKFQAYESVHDISFSKTVEILNEKWIVIEYWYYPASHYSPTERHFSLKSYDEQIYFE
jgi:hypothetical protein